MYYRHNGSGRKTYVTIKTAGGVWYDFPDAGPSPGDGGWHNVTDEGVIRFIETRIANGDSKWERQSLKEKEPEGIKATRKKKKDKAEPDTIVLPPEPEDAPDEPTEEPVKVEEDDDL